MKKFCLTVFVDCNVQNRLVGGGWKRRRPESIEKHKTVGKKKKELEIIFETV